MRDKVSMMVFWCELQNLGHLESLFSIIQQLDISSCTSLSLLQILTAHAQPFRVARDLAFCLKVHLDSLLVWASSGGSGETARMRRLAWTFAARIGDKYQIRLMWSKDSYSFGLSKEVPTFCTISKVLRKSDSLWWMKSELSHLMTKPTVWPVRPAKTQISLGIHPVWSESLLST